MKPSSQSSNTTSFSSTSASIKKAANVSLNLSKASSYLQQQTQQETDNPTPSSARHSQMDMSMLSTVSNLNQTKFQFDIYINKVELTVPSPVYIFVQLLKGTHQVNTKKKLKIDQLNKTATFAEKLSIITALSKASADDGMKAEYQQKLIQLRLMAFYNSKEKAIGICSLDLSQFASQSKEIGSSGKIQQKLVFQKCFDKNASISFEVRAKEQFSAIQEAITEETDQSNTFDNETEGGLDSFRGSIAESNIVTQEDETTEPPIIEKKSSTNSQKLSQENTPQGKTTPLLSQTSRNIDAGLKSLKTQVVQMKSTTSPQKAQLNSARPSMNSSTSLSKFPSQSSTGSQQLADSFQQRPHSSLDSQTLESQAQVKKMEEKIQKLEFEVKSLKQENSEQKQKIITLEIKEERMREYEVKCTEADSYKQKAEILEQHLRQLQEEQQEQERDRIFIIESYERKLHDLRSQLTDTQAQLKQATQQTLYTQEGSTLPNDEEEHKTPFKDDDTDAQGEDYKELYEKAMLKLRKAQEEVVSHKKREDGLEKQLMSSKEQIVQLMNELYSLEKEQFY